MFKQLKTNKNPLKIARKNRHVTYHKTVIRAVDDFSAEMKEARDKGKEF